MRTCLAAILLLAFGCSPADPLAQRTFETPEAAARALGEALERDDQDALLVILGREYEDQFITSDWDAELAARQKIAAAVAEQLELNTIGEDEIELVIGAEEWPLPIHLVRDPDESWHFDSEQGIQNVIDRRIGRNELSAIQLLNAYVDAQIEYAKADRNGDGVLEYAQRLASSPGQRDGLYWEAADAEEPSPLGPLVQGAEAYIDTLEPGDPIRGYYFKVLTRQGENPPGGRYDYVIDGRMIAGFGLVAYPADYGNTAIMTFVVNHRGVIHQQDIGLFTGLVEYDPDARWTEVPTGEQR